MQSQKTVTAFVFARHISDILLLIPWYGEPVLWLAGVTVGLYGAGPGHGLVDRGAHLQAQVQGRVLVVGGRPRDQLWNIKHK